VAARRAYRAAVAAALAGVPPADVAAAFPFAAFFAAQGAPPLNSAAAAAEAAAAEAEARFAALAELFAEIASCKAFEVLRSARARVDYLLLKEARVVAMTTTHAAISRARMRALGFHYDTVVMEEAAQVSEVETFIPLVCQDPVTGASPLKRVVLIGDHHQLPPVVMNAALARWGGLDQSMFARLVRLGVPAVQLSAQGRARPHLAALYAWRYEAGGGLANMRHVEEAPAYRAANAALAAPLALVDVPDFHGQGESAPMPHFYQNLGEAEFLVALFMFMRLHGYPAGSIALLATYNGQVALLKDVVARRCAGGFYGAPAAISTVDRAWPFARKGEDKQHLLTHTHTHTTHPTRPPARQASKGSRRTTCCCHWCAHGRWATCGMCGGWWWRCRARGWAFTWRGARRCSRACRSSRPRSRRCPGGRCACAWASCGPPRGPWSRRRAARGRASPSCAAWSTSWTSWRR
jgi:hypothetical protein